MAELIQMENKMEKRSRTLLTIRLVLAIILMILVWFWVCLGRAETSQPQYGDHLCWYSSVKKNCGTYGWNKNRTLAEFAAFKLCLKECDNSCIFEYCERITK